MNPQLFTILLAHLDFPLTLIYFRDIWHLEQGKILFLLIRSKRYMSINAFFPPSVICNGRRIVMFTGEMCLTHSKFYKQRHIGNT